MLFKIGGKEVIFEFDRSTDTPEGVAREMVKELGLNHSNIEVITKQIQNNLSKNAPKPAETKS